MTPEYIRSVWIKIAVPFAFATILLVTGLVFRSLHNYTLAKPGAFLVLGGTVGILLFGFKAIQFMIYLRNNKP